MIALVKQGGQFSVHSMISPFDDHVLFFAKHFLSWMPWHVKLFAADLVNDPEVLHLQ